MNECMHRISMQHQSWQAVYVVPGGICRQVCRYATVAVYLADDMSTSLLMAPLLACLYDTSLSVSFAVACNWPHVVFLVPFSVF